jgi:hypothetical protein
MHSDLWFHKTLKAREVRNHVKTLSIFYILHFWFFKHLMKLTTGQEVNKKRLHNVASLSTWQFQRQTFSPLAGASRLKCHEKFETLFRNAKSRVQRSDLKFAICSEKNPWGICHSNNFFDQYNENEKKKFIGAENLKFPDLHMAHSLFSIKIYKFNLFTLTL